MLDFYTNLTFQQHREKKMFYEKKPILIRVHILYMHKSCQKWNSKGILQHNTNETQKKTQRYENFQVVDCWKAMTKKNDWLHYREH